MKKEELNKKFIFIIINNIFVLFIMSRVGTRAQVMHGNALRTGGGLTKKDLKYNKQGKIVSKTMSMRAKREKRLEKAGWTVRKGQFGAFKMSGGNIENYEGAEPKNYNSSKTDKRKKVTIIPKHIVSYFLIPKYKNLVRSMNIKGTEYYFTNYKGVLQILHEVRKKYRLGNYEYNTNVPTRNLIMYLGLNKDNFIEMLDNNRSVKQALTHSIMNSAKNKFKKNNNESLINSLKRYAEIDFSRDKQRGLNTTVNKEVYDKQVLWLLADAIIENHVGVYKNKILPKST